MVKPFVFSCDAHIVEPPDLFLEKMPQEMQRWAINSKREGDFGMTCIGDDVILRIPINFTQHKTGIDNSQDIRRLGARDIGLRLKDMDRDGVDAELCFPSLGLVAHRISDKEAALKCCEIYNDWAWEYTREVKERLIPAALLPIQDLDDCLAEFKRCAQIGYAAVMLPPKLPDNIPNYNQPDWDPIFAFAGENNIPIVFHTGTGLVNTIALRGPGGALFNYTRQINDAVDVAAMLVGGGVLDRNPTAKILFVEFGAGWLLGLAERMDEVYLGHAPFIRPKLGRMPTQIVREQIRCSFQNDPGCMLTARKLGWDCLLFATDYPHSEGTFPFSQQVIEQMFDDIPDITEDNKIAILGGNAADLFPHANLKASIEARKVA